jgi:Na+/proline symporter
MAMTGCIILAILVINSPQVGGMSGLQTKLPETVFNFFPSITNAENTAGTMVLSLSSFLAYVGIIWWASWYPGAEPGGGGYVVQRMLSAKNEKHSLFATLFFQVAHYALRPWPWIIVGLATIVLYPELSENQKGLGYIYAMKDFLPVGLKGLLIAAFFAAYMSTIATQLNWGTSYIINDFYKRFIVKDNSEKHYVLTSRIFTLILMILSVVITLFISRISGAWEFILECGAGLGLVLILRWFWWRINAWSEISAMITPFIILPILKLNQVQFPETLFIIVPLTTVVWLIITFLTKPTDENILIAFYRKVYPGGKLWSKISDKIPDAPKQQNFFSMFVNWIAGVVLVYSSLFAIGKIILGFYGDSIIYFALIVFSVIIISRNLSKEGWETIIK